MARELLVIALVAAGGCGGCSKSESAPTGAPLAGKAFYRVDPGPAAPCASGSSCEVRVVLTALGDYHVNKDYPFKFVGDPAAPVAPEGEGSFALDGAKRGTLTIKFRPAAAGSAKVIGNFKLSVCSDDTCEIESPKLELTVPVS
jgi:hypothetical protein